MTLLRKWLILAHRYLGIPLSLVFVVWFVSGIVMMYTGGMPELTPQLRLNRLPALDISRINLTPHDAAKHAKVWLPADSVSLFMVTDRPAYRLDTTTVFADNGEVLGNIGAATAHTVASQFTGHPEEQIQHVGTLQQPDQWTMTYDRVMPLHKFRVDDGLGTELYVSSSTAEVTVLTTQRSRALAWIGAIPHWFYFSALRLNQSLWSQVVIWTATAGCLLAVMGLLLGLTQARTPYTRWMRWHYLTGVVFGVFTLTWVFSGLLSMEPYAWTKARGLELPRDVLSGGPPDLNAFPEMDVKTWERVTGGQAVAELQLTRMQDESYYVARLIPEHLEAAKSERLHQPYYITGRAEPNRLVIAANTMTVKDDAFTVESVMDRLIAATPGMPIVESVMLDEYDSYYYSRRGRIPLPVLRVKFADPSDTWVYVDPHMSRVVTSVHRSNRVERWLFNGLHSLDFGFLYTSRPLWDFIVITLSVGGLASSGIGFWVGLKRLRRPFLRRLSEGSR